MPILDAYEGELDAASRDLLARPQEPRKQAPRFSLWGTIKQLPRDVAAGAAQMAASGVELLGGLAKADLSPEAMSAKTPAELEKVRKKAQQALETGFRDNEVGRSLRNVARDYLPDPTTTHGAQMVVSNLARVGTKLALGSMVMGPAAGGVVAGMEEGFTHSDDLAEKGVNVETRSAVGAVTAATNAVSFALPIAGKTMTQTLGLAAVGGPVSFVAQQGAARYILQKQDYSQLAEQYDPFDPVGLTLATLLPIGFGAVAMRSRSTKPAEGVPSTPGTEPAQQPTPAPHYMDAETVDAARVTLLADKAAESRPVPAEDIAGSAAHERAYEQAIDQLSAGERVAVTDVAPASERIALELQPRLAALRDAVAAHEADLARHTARMQELRPEAALPRDPLSLADAESNLALAHREHLELAETPKWRQLLRPGHEKDLEFAGEKVNAAWAGVFRAEEQARLASAASEGAAAAPGAKLPAAARDGAPGLPIEDAHLNTRATEVEQATPDLMVQLEGMEQPMRVADVMSQLRQQIKEDLDELPLIRAAAECFLSSH